MVDEEPIRGMPAWVKVAAAIGIGFAVLLAVVVLAGGGSHGPSRHLNGDDPAGTTVHTAPEGGGHR